MAFTCLDQTTILQYHQGMIADRERVDRYREAVDEIVKPGDVVVDLGTGTGLLAYFACQAGAARAYAIERGPIMKVAEEMRSDNGFEDRVILLEGDSSTVDLPERADVLVCETLWNFGMGEGIVGTILDARERFLKPDGRVLPMSFDMIAAPVEFPKLYSRIAEPADSYGLDFSALRKYAPSNIYVSRVPAAAPLSEPVTLQHFDLLGSPPGDASGSGTAEVERAGIAHGLAGWFSARLSPSVTLSNPPTEARSSWWQVFFPLSEPVEVAPGDRVEMKVETVANGGVWRWSVQIAGSDRGREPASMDATTFFGFPFDPELASGGL